MSLSLPAQEEAEGTPVCSIVGSLPYIINNTDQIYEGNLRQYYRDVFHQGTHVNNSYHHFGHNLYVVFACYEACKFYADSADSPTPRAMRSLLVAAIFHDFDHPGRTVDDDGKPIPDSVNIERAIDGFRRYVLPEDQPSSDSIEALIRITEFPYRVPTAQLPLLSQIIRDADISHSLSHTWLQQVVFGLAKEQGKTPLEILTGQATFYRNFLKFTTKWAKEKYPRSDIDRKIAEAEAHLEILTSDS